MGALGQKSYFMRMIYGSGGEKRYGDVCLDIACDKGFVGRGKYTFVSYTNGFVCGAGKRCSSGRCESSSSMGSSISATCPFGETPADANIQGMGSCSQLTNGYQACERNPWVQLACCESCEGGSSGGSGGSSYPPDNSYPGGNGYPNDNSYPPTGGNSYPDDDYYPPGGSSYPDSYPPPGGSSYPDDGWYPSGGDYPGGTIIVFGDGGDLPPLPSGNGGYGGDIVWTSSRGKK